MADRMEPTPPSDLQLPETAIAALHLGNKIEAIRIVRESNEIGLKEAKDLVDTYIAGQPNLQGKISEAQSVTKRGSLLFVLFLSVLLATGFILIFKKG